MNPARPASFSADEDNIHKSTRYRPSLGKLRDMNTDPKSIGALLFGPDSQAAKLLDHAEAMLKYQRALEDWAVEYAIGALRVANLREGTLIIHADNGSALTALRFRQTSLLAFLQTRGYQCTEIEAKVAPRPVHGQGGV